MKKGSHDAATVLTLGKERQERVGKRFLYLIAMVIFLNGLVWLFFV